MSWAIWITGIPGSGKSVLARAAAAELQALGTPVKVLELDAIRKIVTPEPTYGDIEREAVYRLLAFMAASLVDAGVPVIVDATAHRRHWRELARGSIQRFAEVQLECPLAVAREREAARAPGNAPRDIYRRAEAAGTTVPGVGREYEPALAPELVIDTTAETVPAAAARIVALADRLAEGSPTGARLDGGWAIWITGRPGSGKTTIARRVTEALTARGLTARIVDATAIRPLVPPMAIASREDFVHRAVVCLAMLLVESGVAVVVDATGHQRRWRDQARHLIPRFAEIQLMCPPEVCAEREQSARWHLGATPPEGPATPSHVELEWVVDYECALQPELTIFTDVQDWVTAVEEVLFVAERLHRLSHDDRRPHDDTPP
jgi:adenylylsulfate kinase